MHAHNTFERPDVVQLSPPKTLDVHGERVRILLPAGSIARITGRLA